ncbi:MAG: fructose-bisphosphate aldolase class I [Deltaproteobacteria bacterium]|nr:fructose-bisphosphate aldolase class I [Deltaproteobacteria bacterium]
MMRKPSLDVIATSILEGHRGVLAADESPTTLGKRFAKVGVPNDEEHRRAYRELLLLAPGAEEAIGGVILHEETLRQETRDGVGFIAALRARDQAVGVKVDRGAHPLPFAPGEVVTEGLDGLRDRLIAYRKLGVTFAKWRAVIDIAPGLPSDLCLRANAHALGRYAALCQENGLVPIVEPEVLMDGDHGIDRCAEVTRRTLGFVFEALYEHRVILEGLLLKPNMVVPGLKSRAACDEAAVADATVAVLKQAVPAAVPGVLFLSGGQREAHATARLQAMNARHPTSPWRLSFSFGRALQASALAIWRGDPDETTAARRAHVARARANQAACRGEYRPEHEPEDLEES